MSCFIALDTETTGIGHESGHRIIEIGCIKVEDRQVTDTQFHVYLNPERTVDEGAFRIHGISNEFLADKPVFKTIYTDFVQFIDGHTLVIHNAAFDLGFLNSELKRVGWTKRIEDRCKIIDTLALSRKKHPGARHNLDALCKRYDVDTSKRTLHGALLDADILATVYLAMTGGQAQLFADSIDQPKEIVWSLGNQTPLHCTGPVIMANQEELKAHHAFMACLARK
jgi:DNA polymerase-3 subunit epsilon